MRRFLSPAACCRLRLAKLALRETEQRKHDAPRLKTEADFTVFLERRNKFQATTMTKMSTAVARAMIM